MADQPIHLQAAEPGAIVVVGHPANGVTARLSPQGTWFYNVPISAAVDYDTLHKNTALVYNPGDHKSGARV